MTLRIRILNWEKYQGKGKSYQHTSWFRIDNRIIEHILWDSMTPPEFKFFIFLMAFVSRNNHTTGEITVDLLSVARKSRVRSDKVLTSLQHLATHGVVEYQEVKVPSRTAHGSLRNITVRNETGTDRKSLELVGEREENSEPEKPKEGGNFERLPAEIREQIRGLQKVGGHNVRPGEQSQESEVQQRSDENRDG